MASNRMANISQARVEKTAFFVLLFLYCIPLLLSKTFVTVDGPAHLHNARLLLELIKGNETLAENYILNPSLNPNLIGHGFLAALMLVLPAWLAEKSLLLSYVIPLPLAFRFFYRSTNFKNQFALYLIFPLTYSYLFYFGFYNFNFGLILFFFLLGYWNRITTITSAQLGFLTVISTLLFFSHLYVFGIFGLCWGLYFIVSPLITNRSFSFDKLGKFLISVSPGLLLMVFYFASNDMGSEQLDFIASNNIIDHLREMGPFKGISLGKESKFTRPFALLWLALVAYGAFHIIKSKSWKEVLPSALSLILLTALLFTLPDGTSSFGFVTFRTMLFFFSFLIIFSGQIGGGKWFSITGDILFIAFSMLLLNIYINASSKLNPKAQELYDFQSSIEAGAVVQPLGSHSQWIHGHVSNYLGTEKGVVILENYEAALAYFPVNWNYEQQPTYVYGVDECKRTATHLSPLNQREVAIDYLVVFDEFTIDDCLLESYQLVLDSETGFKIYKVKRSDPNSSAG